MLAFNNFRRGAMPYVKGTPLERFHRRVIIDDDDHWIFQGADNGKGYVVFWANGRVYAHRFSYIVHIGSIPEGFDVLHHCDIRRCVNPRHLFLGNDADNMQDAKRKGRLQKSPELIAKHKKSAVRGDDHWTRKKMRDEGKTPRPLSRLRSFS